MASTRFLLSALVGVVGFLCLYSGAAPIDEGPAPPSVVNPPCDVNVIMNLTRCTHPDNMNGIADSGTESSLLFCDCPEDYICNAVKAGETYRCDSTEQLQAQQAELQQFNMNMKLGDDEEEE